MAIYTIVMTDRRGGKKRIQNLVSISLSPSNFYGVLPYSKSVMYQCEPNSRRPVLKMILHVFFYFVVDLVGANATVFK